MGCTILAFRNLKYYIKSAASSFRRNGIMTIASFITVTCALLLLGTFLAFALNLNYIGDQLEDYTKINAYLHLGTNESEGRRIYEAIRENANVKEAVFESSEQALANYKETLGENSDFLEGMKGEEFLRSSVKITLRDIKITNRTVKEISQIQGVEEVKHHQDTVEKIMKIADIIERGSLIAMLILLLIIVFIIKNTIKLSVYAREKEIHIMKFVGATDHFIRMPFIFEGIMIGLLGFVVSFLIVIFAYSPVTSILSQLLPFKYIPVQQSALILGGSMALFGIIMGAIGSGLSIKKHHKV